MMGGSVATTVRRESGEVIKMCRRTGSEEFLFLNEHFLTKQFDKAIDDYLKTWNEMRADYLNQLNGGTEKMMMSKFYAPHDALAPEGYGLNVIDFKDKKIYSAQGYNTPGKFNDFSLSAYNRNTDEELQVWMKIVAYDNKCITNWLTDDKEPKSYSFLEYYGTNDLNKIIQMNELHKKSETQELYEYCVKNDLDIKLPIFSERLHLHYDVAGIHGFELNRYEETYDDIKKMFKDLNQAGFDMTEDEVKHWAVYLADQFDEDEITEAGALKDLEQIKNISPSSKVKI